MILGSCFLWKTLQNMVYMNTSIFCIREKGTPLEAVGRKYQKPFEDIRTAKTETRNCKVCDEVKISLLRYKVSTLYMPICKKKTILVGIKGGMKGVHIGNINLQKTNNILLLGNQAERRVFRLQRSISQTKVAQYSCSIYV